MAWHVACNLVSGMLEGGCSVLPISLPTERHGFRSAVEYRPALEVGGDFFAIVARKKGQMSVLIGDACGRGASASFVVARLSPIVRRLLRTVGDPKAVLAELNRAAWTTLSEETFITGACVSLDSVRGRMVVANAGHVPPIVRRAWGVSIVVGSASGPPLGMLASGSYVEHEIDLNVGDVVVLMTDGAVEAVEDDLLGMGKLTSLVSRAPPDVQSINRLIVTETEGRVGQGRRDDFTVLSFQRMWCAAQSATRRLSAR